MAEVSRFKDCDAIGSKDKVCLQELQQTSMLLPRLLTSCRNSSNHFSTLPTTSGLLSALLNDLHLYSHLLGSPQLSFHLSLFSSQLLSTRVDSPHLSSTGPIFLSPVEVTQVQTFFFSAVDLLFHSVDLKLRSAYFKQT